MFPPSIPGSEILFATDFSDSSRRTLAWVKEIARGRGAAVRAVHVIDLTGNGRTESRPGSFAATRDSAERMLREVRRELRLAGIPVTATLIAGGKPARAIREAAAQYQSRLLVLGVKGARSLRPSTLGATAKSLLQRPPCPILMAGAACPEHPPPGGLDRPLFVTDATSEGLNAALMAWPLPTTQPAPALLAVLPAEADEAVELSPEVRELFHAIRILAPREAAKAAIREAAEMRSELIVVGLRGGGHLDSFARSGLAHTLITGALRPVLIARN